MLYALRVRILENDVARYFAPALETDASKIRSVYTRGPNLLYTSTPQKCLNNVHAIIKVVYIVTLELINFSWYFIIHFRNIDSTSFLFSTKKRYVFHCNPGHSVDISTVAVLQSRGSYLFRYYTSSAIVEVERFGLGENEVANISYPWFHQG